MATGFQVTFDCSDPAALGGFWVAVLGYIEQPPPDGYATWDAFLDSVGWPQDQRDAAYAIVDPEGIRPRLYFQRVPEGKSAKNRVHLDVNVGPGPAAPLEERRTVVDAEAERVLGLGATEVGRYEERGEYHVQLRDPEGNEFCIQ